ncbi:MAG: tol-pal system-associated acyl-CoA thioesterase [Rhodospirillales bacterium]
MPDQSGLDLHVHSVRIYYEDTDAGGIVYYANYLKFAERARTEMLRAHGIENGLLMQTERVAFAVRECHADYRKPARLDDLLEIRTRVEELSGASMRMRQDVLRDGEVLVSIAVRLACMDIDNGSPRRLPAIVRNGFGVPVKRS